MEYHNVKQLRWDHYREVNEVLTQLEEKENQCKGKFTLQVVKKGMEENPLSRFVKKRQYEERAEAKLALMKKKAFVMLRAMEDQHKSASNYKDDQLKAKEEKIIHLKHSLEKHAQSERLRELRLRSDLTEQDEVKFLKTQLSCLQKKVKELDVYNKLAVKQKELAEAKFGMALHLNRDQAR